MDDNKRPQKLKIHTLKLLIKLGYSKLKGLGCSITFFFFFFFLLFVINNGFLLLLCYGLVLILTLYVNKCFGCAASMFIISRTSITTSIIAHHERIDNQGIATYNSFIVETPFISGFCKVVDREGESGLNFYFNTVQFENILTIDINNKFVCMRTGTYKKYSI